MFAGKAVDCSIGSPGSMPEMSFAVPLTVDLEKVRATALKMAERLAPAPEGGGNRAEVRDLGLSEVTLGMSAWAAEPLEQRRLAGDLRTAIVGWLIRDDLLGDSSGTKGQAAEDHPG